jgi:hypothetical protein
MFFFFMFLNSPPREAPKKRDKTKSRKKIGFGFLSIVDCRFVKSFVLKTRKIISVVCGCFDPPRTEEHPKTH